MSSQPLKICVEVRNCFDCRHKDHSGAFTLGGAKRICSHPDVSDIVSKIKKLHKLTTVDLRKINSTKASERQEGNEIFKGSSTYWKHRILPNGGNVLPDWCPLKYGRGY